MLRKHLAALVLLLAASGSAAAQLGPPALTGQLSTAQDRTTTVVAGSYTCPTLSIDATGRATAASNGTCSATTTPNVASLNAATNAVASFLTQTVLGTYEWLMGVTVEPSIAALRANTTPWPTIHVQGWNGPGTPGGGDFEYVSTDTSTADNSCSVFVDGATPTGHRYYRDLKTLGIDVTDCGAQGGNASVDTAAFQAAVNLAGSSPIGLVHVPHNSIPYLVNYIDEAGINGVTVLGDGNDSTIAIGGADSAGNWWDLAGSFGPHFRDLSIVSTTSTPPNVLFFWACTGTSCGTSGVLSGLSFDHVNIAAKSAQAFLFGYGFGPVGGAATNSAATDGSLTIRDSTWTQLNNGAACSGLNIYKCNAVVRLDALNSLSLTSTNATVTATTASAWRAVFSNFDIVDKPVGFGGGTLDNNAAAVFYNANQLTVIGGSFQCLCTADTVLWHDNEGLTFVQTAFEASDGGAGSVWYWADMGGGLNGLITYITPFWSSPVAGFIALDAAVSGAGGVNDLRVIGNDVGLNAVPVDFIAETNNGCGGFAASSNWITLSDLDFQPSAGVLNLCGSVDNHTIFRNVSTVYVPSGGADNSHHF